jgi:hypothetical protein
MTSAASLALVYLTPRGLAELGDHLGGGHGFGEHGVVVGDRVRPGCPRGRDNLSGVGPAWLTALVRLAALRTGREARFELLNHRRDQVVELAD